MEYQPRPFTQLLCRERVWCHISIVLIISLEQYKQTLNLWLGKGFGWRGYYVIVFLLSRQHAGSADNTVDWADDGINSVGGYQHAEWLGRRKVCMCVLYGLHDQSLAN